jgi:hypothetical protein
MFPSENCINEGTLSQKTETTNTIIQVLIPQAPVYTTFFDFTRVPEN